LARFTTIQRYDSDLEDIAMFDDDGDLETGHLIIYDKVKENG